MKCTSECVESQTFRTERNEIQWQRKFVAFFLAAQFATSATELVINNRKHWILWQALHFQHYACVLIRRHEISYYPAIWHMHVYYLHRDHSAQKKKWTILTSIHSSQLLFSPHLISMAKQLSRISREASRKKWRSRDGSESHFVVNVFLSACVSRVYDAV